MYLRSGNTAAAIHTLKRALTQDPDHAQAHALLARALVPAQ